MPSSNKTFRVVTMNGAQPINKALGNEPWPVRPRPIDGEATVGFMMRVAHANGYDSLRQLHAGVKDFGAIYEGVRLSLPERKSLFGPHPSYWGHNDFTLGLIAADFNHHLMRWCPLCLQQSSCLRGQWMLKLCCACSRHSICLHDRCPVCGLAQRLERKDFERCVCGARLAAAPIQMVAAPLLHATQAIEASIFGEPTPLALPSLSTPEWLRLAVYLGQFSETFQPARPGKIANLHQLEKARFLMSGISQLLDNWPNNFHAILAAIQRNAEASPSIRRAFGSLYRVLYNDLRGGNFQFLRDEFECYLSTHWWGIVCKRNRSFKAQTIAAHPRMTLKQAANQAGVAPATVRHLVQSELIHGAQFVFPSGRKSQSIHRDDLVQIVSLANGGVTISAAAEQLVLPERRVRELISGGIISPLVSRIHDRAAAWLIPEQQVRTMFFAGGGLLGKSPSISVGRLLRFWRLFDGEFIALVQALSSNLLLPANFSSGAVPLGNVLLDVEVVRNWLSSHRHVSGSNMSIVKAAKLLGLKQQVAYDLARSGLLATVRNNSNGSRVTPESIENFRTSYISLADLSRSAQRSPSWLLRNLHIPPISGPAIDGSRQYFFRKSDVIPEWPPVEVMSTDASSIFGAP